MNASLRREVARWLVLGLGYSLAWRLSYLFPTLARPLVEERGLSEGAVGSLIGWVNLGFVAIGLLVLVQVSRRVPRRPLVVGAFAVQAAALTAAALSADLVVLRAAACVVGITMATMWIIDERVDDHFAQIGSEVRGRRASVRLLFAAMAFIATMRLVDLALANAIGVRGVLLIVAAESALVTLLVAPALWREAGERRVPSWGQVVIDLGRAGASPFVWLMVTVTMCASAALSLFDGYHYLMLTGWGIPGWAFVVLGVMFAIGGIVAHRSSPRYETRPPVPLLVGGVLTLAAGATLLAVQPLAPAGGWLAGQFVAQILIESGTSLVTFGLTPYTRLFMARELRTGAISLILAGKFGAAALAPLVVGERAWTHLGWSGIALASTGFALLALLATVLIVVLYLRPGAPMLRRDRRTASPYPEEGVELLSLKALVDRARRSERWIIRYRLVMETDDGRHKLAGITAMRRAGSAHREPAANQKLIAGTTARVVYEEYEFQLEWSSADVSAILTRHNLCLPAGVMHVEPWSIGLVTTRRPHRRRRRTQSRA